MKLKQVVPLAAMAVALVVPSAPAFASTPELTWADRLIADLPTPSASNDYGSPTSVTWAGVGGASVSFNRSTCAPFVTRLLRQGRGWGDSAFKGWFSSTSPSSEKYYDAISGGKAPFVARSSVGAIAAGDVIAVRYDGDESASGHTMIAAGPALSHTASAPLVDGTTQWTVEVVDSTSTPHGDDDTRRYLDAGVLKSAEGAGRGKIRVYADADGRIVGHTWSVKSTTYRANAAGARPLAVGGIDPLAVPAL